MASSPEPANGDLDRALLAPSANPPVRQDLVSPWSGWYCESSTSAPGLADLSALGHELAAHLRRSYPIPGTWRTSSSGTDSPGGQAFYAVSVRRLAPWRSGFLQTVLARLPLPSARSYLPMTTWIRFEPKLPTAKQSLGGEIARVVAEFRWDSGRL